MIEFYPQIKLVHIAAIVCSGALFFLRHRYEHFVCDDLHDLFDQFQPLFSWA